MVTRYYTVGEEVKGMEGAGAETGVGFKVQDYLYIHINTNTNGVTCTQQMK